MQLSGYLLLLLLHPLPLTVASDLCSKLLNGQERTVCKCFNEKVDVRCRNSSLDSVPNDLSPLLDTLDLTFNSIEVVYSLYAYEELKILWMPHNQIHSVSEDCFRANDKLLTLDLSHNQIAAIGRRTFNGLRQLTKLDLSHNMISTIEEESFYSQDSLLELNLASNHLHEISEQVFLGPVSSSLNTLALNQNFFKTFPTSALARLVKLSVLDFSDNNVVRLENPVFTSLTCLTQLRLRECGLNNIGSSAFDGLSRLTLLDISHNSLREVPDNSFLYLPELDTLDIGGNYINSISDRNFKNLRGLKIFSMRDCKEELRLEEGVFSQNQELTEIHLTKCSMQHIDEEVSLHYLPMLKVMNLHGNQLTGLHKEFVPAPDLDRLDLTGNPLECSCSLAWLRVILQGKPTLGPLNSCTVGGVEEKIIYVNEEAFSCDDTTQAGWFLPVIVITGVIATAIIMAAIGYILLRNYRSREWELPTWSASAALCSEISCLNLCCRRSARRRIKKGFRGKQDIEVIQNLNVQDDRGKFIDLPGLNQDQRSSDSHNGSPLYAEVTEQPINFPDVKISNI